MSKISADSLTCCNTIEIFGQDAMKYLPHSQALLASAVIPKQSYDSRFKKDLEVEGKYKITNNVIVVMKILYDLSVSQWSMMLSIDECWNRILLVVIILQDIYYLKNNVIFKLENTLIFENVEMSSKSCHQSKIRTCHKKECTDITMCNKCMTNLYIRLSWYKIKHSKIAFFKNRLYLENRNINMTVFRYSIFLKNKLFSRYSLFLSSAWRDTIHL